MKLPDMMAAVYEADYFNSLLSSLSAKGRNALLFIQLPVDMI